MASFIEAQELEGQRLLSNISILPKHVTGRATWEQLEQLGIVRLGDYDNLFYKVQLPIGWRVQPTEHNMWSDLLDEQGRKRGNIFYKPAFYDCWADMNLYCRYCAVWDWEYTDNHKILRGCVMDQDTSIWFTDEFVLEPQDDDGEDKLRNFFDTRERLYQQALAWLNEHKPDHLNPLAYW